MGYEANTEGGGARADGASGSTPSRDAPREASRNDLSTRERHFAEIADAAPTVLWTSDPKGRVTYFSRAWYDLTAQSVHDSLYGDWADMLHEADVERVRHGYYYAIENRLPFRYDYRLLLQDGGYRWVNDSGRPRFAAGGSYLGHIGTIVDVHDLVLQSEALRERERHLARMTEFRRSVLELVEHGLATRDPGAFYQRMLDRAVSVIDGAEAGALLTRAEDGRFDYAAAVGYDLAALQEVRFDADAAGFGRAREDAYPGVIWGPLEPPSDFGARESDILRTAGRAEEIRAVLVIPIVIEGVPTAVLTLDTFAARDAFGAEATEMARIFGAHAATLFRRLSLEADLHTLAYRDALTGLANRAMFVETLERSLAHRGDEECVAVLFVDLDDLKPINDTLGHRAGDDVLREVARRLQQSVGRRTLVARLGGDEFTVLLTGERAAKQAPRLAGRILAALEPRIATGTHELHVGASIGVSGSPDDGRTAEDLLRRADMAMYHVKTRGKGDVRTFAPHMESGPRDRLLLEEALRRGLDRDEFELHYQPRVEMATGRITAMEALVRWRHPERGLLQPESFVEVAENSGLIHALGGRVLEMAARQVRAWRDQGFAGLRVAVNVNARQLERAGLMSDVERILEQAKLPADALELEVLERTAMTDVSLRASRLEDLRRTGVRIALAGFGVGHSTLSHLRVLPIDTLKIDRSFVRGLGPDDAARRDVAIVHSVAVLGNALGLRVVAEGIEQPEAWHVLKEAGAHEAQGYLIQPPVPAAEVEALLRAGPFRPDA